MALLERTNSRIFAALLGISAIGIAFMAAFFSVTGLSMVYAGSSLFIAVAMGVLEFSKLITASFLYRYWSEISFKVKFYLTLAVVILMVLTSGGIYGYLTNAYQGATIDLDKMNSEIRYLEDQEAGLIADRDRLVQDRNALMEIRNQDVSGISIIDSTRYLDQRYRQRAFDRYKDELQSINSQADSTTARLLRVQDELATKKRAMIDTGVEVGPLVYMAKVFNTSMDRVMNWFSLLIVLVFDPLAVVLIIAFNFVLIKIRDENFAIQSSRVVAEDISLEEQVDDGSEGIDYEVQEALSQLEDEDDEIVVENENESENDDISLKDDVSPIGEIDENSENIIDKDDDDPSLFQKRPRFSQPNKKVDIVEEEKPDGQELFSDMIDITHDYSLDQVIPTEERIVQKPAKSGDIPKEKIVAAVDAVKKKDEESDDVPDDVSDAIADDSDADEIVGMLSEEAVKESGEILGRDVVSDVKIEPERQKKVDPLTDNEILNKFDDAARKARMTAKEEIKRVSYEPGGEVNIDFAIQE